MLDVHRLRLLRELARQGTIAAAARACSLTPSAVSQQLAVLEREAGTPLYFRDGRRLVLTEAALVLVEHTEQVLAELERASASVAALTSTVRGVLRLAAFPTAARALAADAIARCRAAHPDLRVRLSEQETADALEALRGGRIDVALVYEYSLLPGVRDVAVETEPLVTEPLLLALPADLPADLRAGPGPLPLASLADQPWIAASQDDTLRAMLARACAAAGFEPRLDFISSDYTVIFALVRAGLGVSIVPRLALESMSADIELREIADLELTRTVSVAVRAGSRRGPQIAAMLAALHEVAAELAG
ncbi:MAG: LysR family transcriptional regulator [Actinophytocola sp.]|uniref:LysR family transcriptional regulator n=1 Tax=Actinophytocola sp. TaxID=1872138 RepID=UPI00132AE1E3|nr:LysR family transcriptional regulator [Actinophytocola sp.]MPZ84845.1 LysR family transcriptional regulator [Actinophytocola sp.]